MTSPQPTVSTIPPEVTRPKNSFRSLKSQVTPTATTDGTAGWKIMTLNKLTFKVPPGWFTAKSESDNKTYINILIHPEPLPDVGDAIPVFSVTFRSNKSVEQEKKEMIENSPLNDHRERTLNVNSTQATELTGTITYGPLEGAKLKSMLFQVGENLCIFQDYGKSSYQGVFDQILSTFKFL